MTRPGVLLLVSLALAAAGCAGHPLARLDVVKQAAGLTSCTFDLAGSSLYQRGVLYVQPTTSLQVTVEATDLATPFVQKVTVPSLAAPVSVTVDKVPAGPLRVVTLQWLDASGSPLDGVYYRAQGTLDDQHQHMQFNNQTTAEGTALLAAFKKDKDKAATLDSSDISSYMFGVLATTRATDARFLDYDKIATAILSSKNVGSGEDVPVLERYPLPDKAWVFQPGFVSAGFTDIEDGMLVRLSVNDPTSGYAVTEHGDTMLLGPIPAKDTPYLLSAQVVPTVGEAIGADLVLPPQNVTVKAGQSVIATPFSFVKSTAGARLPERAGRGAAVQVGDDLWMAGGVKVPDNFLTTGVTVDASDIPLNPSQASGAAYRYVDATPAWTKPVTLPAGYPVFGTAAAAVGTKIYVFGGLDQATEARVGSTGVIDTVANTYTAGRAMPALDGEAALKLAGATAASVGGKVYIAGGQAHDAAASVLTQTLVYDPGSDSFSQLKGPKFPFMDMSGAVVDGRWYVFGGSDAIAGVTQPHDMVQIFDPATGNWTVSNAAMPTPRYGAACCVQGSKIWVIGGEGLRGGTSRAVEVFDTVSGSWTRRAPLRMPRSYAAAIAGKRGKIVVAGGVEGASFTGFSLPVDPGLTEELTP